MPAQAGESKASEMFMPDCECYALARVGVAEN